MGRLKMSLYPICRQIRSDFNYALNPWWHPICFMSMICIVYYVVDRHKHVKIINVVLKNTFEDCCNRLSWRSAKKYWSSLAEWICFSKHGRVHAKFITVSKHNTAVSIDGVGIWGDIHCRNFRYQHRYHLQDAGY